MNNDFQRMLKSAGISTSDADDSIVTLEITEELIARLRAVHKDFEDLRFLCKKTLKRDDGDEFIDGDKFIKGRQYVVHRIWEDNSLCVIDEDGDHCKVGGIEAITKYFAFKTTQSRLAAIEKMASLSSREHKDKLAKAVKSFVFETHVFAPGMRVRWKRDITPNCRRPAVGEAAIVLEVLEPVRVINDDTVGSPVGGSKFDIVIGVLDDDGDLLTFLMDSRRFEPDEEA